MKIAILGGTGAEGSGLGFRWANAGYEIIIGSRSAERAQQKAEELNNALPNGGTITGTDNLTATQEGDVVVLSVPYSAQEKTLAGIQDALSDKLIVTVVAPLGKPAGRAILLESGLSAAEEAQQQVGESARVVAAFQNISAHHLMDLEYDLDCDVLVCGDKGADKKVAISLCEAAGLRGINAGALQNARVAEGLTAVLISINAINKVKGAGIRVTGL